MSDTLRTRLWINIALIAGAVLLALILWLNPGKTPDYVPLSKLDKSSIKLIDIRTGTKPQITLEKHDGDWLLVKPFSIAANTSRVNAILNLLTTYAGAYYPAGQLDLDQFGLLPPAAVVQFDGAEFDFGATDPLSGKRYVLHNHTLYLIDDFIYPMLHADIGALVSRQLIPVSSPVTGFELANFRLLRSDSSNWEIHPENPNLSAVDLQAWIDDWLGAQAILVEQQPMSGKDSEFVTVYFEKGDPIRYRILNQGDEPALYRDDLALHYSLGGEIFYSLVTGPLPMADEFDPDSMIKVDAPPPGASTYDRQGWRKCRLCTTPRMEEVERRRRPKSRSTLSARPSLDIVDALPPGASTYRPSLDIVSTD